MSIINAFDPSSEQIVDPVTYSPPVKDFPETVIITFKRRIFDMLIAEHGGEVCDHMSAGVGVPVYKIKHGGRTFAIYQSLIGAPAAAFLLEGAIAKGGRKFVVITAGGQFDASIPLGGVIVPTEVYRDEGTSYHYAPASDYLKIPTADRLSDILDGLNVQYNRGKIWSTDAFYRETEDKRKTRAEEGCIAFDMECSALAAVGRFRGVDMYQFLYTEDGPGGATWDRRPNGVTPQNSTAWYANLTLDVALRV